MKRTLLMLLVCLPWCVHAATAALRVAGKAVSGEQGVARTAFLMPDFPGHEAARVLLPPPLQEAPKQAPLTKRARVGIGRDAAAEWSGQSVRWVAGEGGVRVARIEVTSATARAVRAGLAVRALPPGTSLRFAGSADPSRVLGPFDGQEARHATATYGVFWSPVTEGDTQVIEIAVPAAAPVSAASLEVRGAAHIDVVPSLAFHKAAAACHVDVACSAETSDAVARAARSVVKLLYTENGVSYLCTGTLVSDGGPQSEIPYVHTAAHCIDSQAAAATLNSFWFFESAACNSGRPREYRQLAGGATLLFSNAASDVSLLRLSERAPAGAWFSGWSAAPPQPGEPVVGLHHPRGDLKKIATGRAAAAAGASPAFTPVAWLMGTTEPGSSGSGLFMLDRGEYLLRGALRGGPATCDSSGREDDPSNRDYYSRLDADAAALSTWLAAAAAPMEDYTDMWWDPAQPGWGLSIVQHASNNMFVTWFMHDGLGRPTWLVIPGVTWRSVSSAEGTIYRAAGPAPAAPYEPAEIVAVPLGSARLDFPSRDSATFTYVIEGRSGVRPLRRQSF